VVVMLMTVVLVRGVISSGIASLCGLYWLGSRLLGSTLSSGVLWLSVEEILELLPGTQFLSGVLGRLFR